MVFGDSSGFLATFLRRDPAHRQALSVWEEISRRGERIITTQLVLSETLTLLRRRGGWEASRRGGDLLLKSRGVEIVALDAGQVRAVWVEFGRNADSHFSFCDAASFVVMRDRGIVRALTLDRDFTSAGFEALLV